MRRLAEAGIEPPGIFPIAASTAQLDLRAASAARRDPRASTAARRDMPAAFAARRDISHASASMLASPWWQSLDPELTLAMADAREQ